MMKKDIKNLTQEIFKDRELLRYIGFSQEETEIFHRLIQGESITKIAMDLKISPYHIRKIRKQKFHLIPVFMRRKMALIKEVPLTDIYQQLSTLEIVISDSMETFKKFYTIPIQDLPISKKTINALIAGGIKNTDQLCKCSSIELKLLRSVGDKTVMEIESVLAQRGLRLRGL